jgi:hypothetical protein
MARISEAPRPLPPLLDSTYRWKSIDFDHSLKDPPVAPVRACAWAACCRFPRRLIEASTGRTSHLCNNLLLICTDGMPEGRAGLSPPVRRCEVAKLAGSGQISGRRFFLTCLGIDRKPHEPRQSVLFRSLPRYGVFCSGWNMCRIKRVRQQHRGNQLVQE